MDTPPKPSHLPEWASDELPLLTETVGEPPIPLLREPLLREPPLREPPLREPQAPLPPPDGRETPPPAAVAPRPSAPPPRGEPLAQIERELHAAAQLIMQEVIDDYMLKIEAELHRRLEDHLASILRAGRR
ncbi:DNA polymerase III subunit chi [Pseudomonas stutzeri]|nr:DNA polymerase III subunit chi [Stutzerimonas stutzeri]